MSDLSKKQEAVRNFIATELAAGRYCPTHREIAGHFGFASSYAAACHVNALVRKEALIAEDGKARALRLADGFQPVRRATVVEIPVFGSIPAGFSRDREQEAGECVPVTVDSIGFKPTRNTFALRVAGDSMIGKHICDGDIVVFEHGPDVQAPACCLRHCSDSGECISFKPIVHVDERLSSGALAFSR